MPEEQHVELPAADVSSGGQGRQEAMPVVAEGVGLYVLASQGVHKEEAFRE